MPDVKISALPSATTPLAGTEVLPIVQGGTTDQVSVANLTAGRTVAAAGLTVDANSATPAVRITQTGAGNALLVEDSASTDSTPFVIGSNGSLIVGATTAFPASTVTPFVNFLGIGNTTAAQNIGINSFGANAFSPAIYFGKSRGANVGDAGLVSSNDGLGTFFFEGSDGTSQVRAASISAAVDGTPGTNDMPGRLVFSTTADGASSPTERMRIDNAGNVGIGVTASAGRNLSIGKNLTGATVAFGIRISATVLSDVTTEVTGLSNILNTQAAAFTLPDYTHFGAAQGTIGATSAVTRQYGFFASGSMTGASSNYGFYGAIADGAGRWNFYAAGTAPNLFSGNVTIFGAGGLGYSTGSGGAVTQATSRTTGVTLNKTNGAITLVSAAGSASYQTFTVTNSTVIATDTINICQKSGTDKYIVMVTNVAAGSFDVTFATTGGTTTEQPVFNFAVIKAVTA